MVCGRLSFCFSSQTYVGRELRRFLRNEAIIPKCLRYEGFLPVTAASTHGDGITVSLFHPRRGFLVLPSSHSSRDFRRPFSAASAATMLFLLLSSDSFVDLLSLEDVLKSSSSDSLSIFLLILFSGFSPTRTNFPPIPYWPYRLICSLRFCISGIPLRSTTESPSTPKKFILD